MKIGIIGTRRRDDKVTFNKIRRRFAEIYTEGDIIVSGGCPKGGDRCAEPRAVPGRLCQEQGLLQRQPAPGA